MRTGKARRPHRALSAVRSSRLPCRHVLAAPILLFLHGPAQSAEELIELSQDDGQWVMPAKNYASTRFSGLDQINADNVQATCRSPGRSPPG